MSRLMPAQRGLGRFAVAAVLAAVVLLGASRDESATGAAAEDPFVELLARVRDDLAEGEAGRSAQALRRALAQRRDHELVSEGRLLLARVFLELGKAPLAHNELLKLEARDPEFFAASEAPRLLRRTGELLGLVDGADAPRDAAQVFVVPRLRGGTRQLWRALSESGVELGIVRAFHLKGDRPHEGRPPAIDAGVYFPTRHVPLVEDRLGIDCDAMRASGLRCLAWMTTRRTPAPSLEATAHRDVAWDPVAGQLEVVERLDLFDPEVVRVLEDVFRDMARSGADGALFQDDLVMRRGEGFSKEARRAWKKRTRRKLEPARIATAPDGRWVDGPDAAEFARFKRDRVLHVASRLRDAAREVTPSFEVALNLYYETALMPEAGLAWLAQDLEAAAALDFRWLAIMAYHRQIAHELEVSDVELAAALESMAERLATVPDAERRVLVKLQSIDWRTREPIPADELARAAAPFRRFALCLAPADEPERARELFASLRPGR